MATVENEKNAGLAKDGGMDSSYESHGKIVDIEAHTGQPGGARSEGDTTVNTLKSKLAFSISHMLPC